MVDSVAGGTGGFSLLPNVECLRAQANFRTKRYLHSARKGLVTPSLKQGTPDAGAEKKNTKLRIRRQKYHAWFAFMLTRQFACLRQKNMRRVANHLRTGVLEIQQDALHYTSIISGSEVCLKPDSSFLVLPIAWILTALFQKDVVRRRPKKVCTKRIALGTDLHIIAIGSVPLSSIIC